MARHVVSLEKLAEAQEAADAAVEAADAAMEAATLAAAKVAEAANLEKPAKAQEANGGGTADGYQIIRDGLEGFSVEGFFRQDGSQIFRSAKGFPSEAAARQWVYDQLAEDSELTRTEGRP